MISSPVDNRPMNPNARYYAMAEQWKSHLCLGFGGGQLLSGVITAISVFPSCIVTGIIQVICALVILAVESPTLISPFLPQLQPIAAMFENRPVWQKLALFSGLFFLPFVIGCFGLFFILGQICALGVAVVYGLIYLGQKGNINNMSYQQGGDEQIQQPYSATTP